MNRTSVNAPRGVSEFDFAGLVAEPSRMVKPPRVAGVPAALECKVTEILHPKTLEGPSSVDVVVGQVVGVHIDDAYLKDGLFDTAKAGNVARLGYFDYAQVDETFSMRRPKWEKD